MPTGLEGTVFYEPAPNPQEDRLKAYLEACWPKYYTKKVIQFTIFSLNLCHVNINNNGN